MKLEICRLNTCDFSIAPYAICVYLSQWPSRSEIFDLDLSFEGNWLKIALDIGFKNFMLAFVYN